MIEPRCFAAVNGPSWTRTVPPGSPCPVSVNCLLRPCSFIARIQHIQTQLYLHVFEGPPGEAKDSGAAQKAISAVTLSTRPLYEDAFWVWRVGWWFGDASQRPHSLA